jgi:Tol biopolymer transport system component
VSASDDGVLAFAAGTGTSRLSWVDRAGVPAGMPLAVGERPTLSADGNRAVIQRADPQSDNVDLWLIDVKRGTEMRFTSNRGPDNWPAFSADGQLVAYSSSQGGEARLHVKRADGDGRDEPLPVSGANPDWSPDGRWILFQISRPKTGFDLLAWSLADRQSIPIAQTEHGEREGRFSPDGKWVAYDSTESGRREIWIQPFPPSGSRWQVSTSGGVSPQWRRDGKELYYVRADGMLMALPIQSGSRPEWGMPQPLFQTTFGGGIYASYAADRDGQRFLLPVPPGAEDVRPITVVLNWVAQLQR